MKKALRMACMVPIALPLVLLTLWFVFKVLGGFANFEMTRRDPVSHLQYTIPIKLLVRSSFRLIVREVPKEEIPSARLSYADLQQEKKKRGLSSLSVSEGRATESGFSYVRVEQDKCFTGVVQSLTLLADQEKTATESCDHASGFEQELFYVSVDGRTYEFTTPYPTRIILRDSRSDRPPEIISKQDFLGVINSLKK